MLQSLRIALLGLAASTVALSAADASRPVQRIEVAFVLDTTGSMADLIDGAKRKIWSIANSIVDVNPNADIRMALIGYRDRDDEYVVRTRDMSGDLQGLYGELVRFCADGGGDTPESVNEALDAAVHDLHWSRDTDVRRIIFLVGDAPPHMDYPNGPKYRHVIRDAREAGIIVNTIQAGQDPETTEFWKDMAELGRGQYFAIPQDGGQLQVMSSPYDQKIIELQGRIDKTALPYGSSTQQEELRAKLATKAAAPAAVQVDNSQFYAKRGAVREIVTGGGDLVDDVRNNVRKLDEISKDELPTDLQGLEADQLQAAVAERTAERAKLEAEMLELSKQRDAYVADELKRQKPGAGDDSFDKRVTEALSAQF
jgi:Mg-chelatase subunit ChlD